MSVPKRTFQMAANDCLVLPPNGEAVVALSDAQLRVESHAQKQVAQRAWDSVAGSGNLPFELKSREAIVLRLGVLRNTGAEICRLYFPDKIAFLRERYIIGKKEKELGPAGNFQRAIQDFYLYDLGSHRGLLDACKSLHDHTQLDAGLIEDMWQALQQKRYTDVIRDLHTQRCDPRLQKT